LNPAALARRAPEYLPLAVAVLAQAVINWHFLSRSYFFIDDFKVLHDGLVGSLSLHYLVSEPIAHFSPGHRLVTLLLEQHAKFNWDLASGLLLLFNSVAVVLLQRILALWAGPRWWTHVLAFGYGVSILLMPSLQWFSAGLLTITAAAFSLAAIHAHLCWRATGRRRWLAWSVVAMTGGLLFYEKAALIPVYLVLMRLLVLEPSERVRDSVRALGREWRVWALYAIPLVAYLPAYLSRGYLQPWQSAPWGDVLTFLRVTWLHAFVPGVLGVRLTLFDGGAGVTWTVVACEIVMGAVVAATIARARSAWRPWAFFAAVFLLNAVVVLPRVVAFGPYVSAYIVRYLTEPAFLFALSLGWAIAWPRGAVPAPVKLPSAAGRWLLRSHPPRAVLAAGVTCALTAYVVLVWIGDAATIRDSPASASRSWVSNLSADIERDSRAGLRPVLLDGPDPPKIGPFPLPPGPNFLSVTIPDFISGVRFDVVSEHTSSVAPDGHLQAVRFEAATGGPVTQVSSRGLLLSATGDGAAAFGRSGCVTTRSGWAAVELRAPQPLRGRTWYLQSSYRTAPGTHLFMAVDRGVGYPPVWDRGLPPNTGGGAVLTSLGALPGVPTFVRLSVDVPPGHSACFSSLVVGSYVAAPAS
jgi:hypothetical protein